MKLKDNNLMLAFVTVLTVIIWLWAAGQTKDKETLTTTIRFRAPEGSSSTVTPESDSITLTFAGTQSAIENARGACATGLDLTIVETNDPEYDLKDMATQINSIGAIKKTGVEVLSTQPTSFKLNIQSMVQVEAAVEPVLSNIAVSGDVTVDPATVTLTIPEAIRNKLPEAITVQAVVSDNALEQLLPGVVHTGDATIRLPLALDMQNVNISPSRVTVTFKIQSKTQSTTMQQVRIILAGHPEDYASYSIELPRKTLSNVTVEADNDIIEKVESGLYTVFAVLQLSSLDMERGVKRKGITSFIAIDDEGVGHPLSVTIDDPDLLNIDLEIQPIAERNKS